MGNLTDRLSALPENFNHSCSLVMFLDTLHPASLRRGVHQGAQTVEGLMKCTLSIRNVLLCLTGVVLAVPSTHGRGDGSSTGFSHALHLC